MINPEPVHPLKPVWTIADTPPTDGREVLVFGRLEGGEKDRHFLGRYNATDNQWYQSETDRKINAGLWTEIPGFDWSSEALNVHGVPRGDFRASPGGTGAGTDD
jgi:hypothetical protein